MSKVVFILTLPVLLFPIRYSYEGKEFNKTMECNNSREAGTCSAGIGYVDSTNETVNLFAGDSNTPSLLFGHIRIHISDKHN